MNISVIQDVPIKTGQLARRNQESGPVLSGISSSARVKERVKLYLYSLSGCSWSVVERTLPLPLYIRVS
jgi:hypothetical protein